jgi:4'-phosphopantetheinyl transferase EntD
VIEAILPEVVSSAEAFADPPDAVLLGAETAIVANAVDKRRQEFTTGRGCARRALGKLGFPPVPILAGERGAPQWPAGVVGSITHCAGYRAAAVARSHDLLTLGLDAEPDGALPDGVLAAIASAGERARLRDLAVAEPGICWDRLLFSAKESVYKAWFPLTRRRLDFDEAEVVIEPTAGTFDARLRVRAPIVRGRELAAFTGRWMAGNGLLLTTVALPAPDR